MTLLVLEDEEALKNVICKKLLLNGFKTVSARSVDQAMKYLQDDIVIDGIWLDHYLLGKENGLDFVAKIKESEKWKKIPVFVVSNTASPGKVKSYLELGVRQYFTKSNYRLDQIIYEIKDHLERGVK